MKCYYEVLQVDREANDGEIKTAYRKLALKWHPDKNLENTELAKEQFQLVQQAYDVLSDRQERAWYDKHRESILHGADSEYKDEFIDVFPYFTTSCFKGFGDDENGFYSVYGKVFDKLIEEEMKFVSSTKDGFHNIPKFGNSTSDYEDIVRPFYDYWSSYSTKKPFSWLDPHDIRNIGNRKVVKMVEKENEKVRQKAKKERNEEIRNLVAFVRKRDKRVQTYLKLMEAKKLENREKQELMMKEKKLQRIQQINNSGNQAEWMKFDNVKSELEEIEKSLASEFGDVSCESEDEDRVEENISNLYCVACNKMFKNVNAFKNHESSKKHKENVARIKESMREDNLEIGMSNNEDSSIGQLSESEEETAVRKSKKANNSKEFKTASTDLYCVACDKEFKNISTFKNHESSKKHQVNYLKLANSTKRDDVELGNCTNIDESPLNSLSEIEDEIILEKPKKKNKSKKTKNVIKPEPSDVEIEISHSLSESEEAIIEKPKKKNKLRKSKNVIKLESSDDEILSSQKEVKNGITDSIHQVNGDELHDDKVVEQTKPRKEKQKKKKTKEVNVSGVSTKKELNLDLCCGKCSSEFPSKNKLFEHLKKTGHSMFLPSAGNKSKGKKGKVKEDLF